MTASSEPSPKTSFFSSLISHEILCIMFSTSYEPSRPFSRVLSNLGINFSFKNLLFRHSINTSTSSNCHSFSRPTPSVTSILHTSFFSAKLNFFVVVYGYLLTLSKFFVLQLPFKAKASRAAGTIEVSFQLPVPCNSFYGFVKEKEWKRLSVLHLK